MFSRGRNDCTLALVQRELQSCAQCQAIPLATQLSLSVDDYSQIRWLVRMGQLLTRANDRGNHFHLVG